MAKYQARHPDQQTMFEIQIVGLKDQGKMKINFIEKLEDIIQLLKRTVKPLKQAKENNSENSGNSLTYQNEPLSPAQLIGKQGLHRRNQYCTTADEEKTQERQHLLSPYA